MRTAIVAFFIALLGLGYVIVRDINCPTCKVCPTCPPAVACGPDTIKVDQEDGTKICANLEKKVSCGDGTIPITTKLGEPAGGALFTREEIVCKSEIVKCGEGTTDEVASTEPDGRGGTVDRDKCVPDKL